jgi:hypothetical protein
VFLGFVVGVSGCGGSGGSSDRVQAAPPAAAGLKDLALGPITGFGSVWVGGDRYDTDNAEFYHDDDIATQADFEIGMFVKVVGDFDDGRADIVSYDEDIKGPLDEIKLGEPDGDILVVVGQDVLITPNTHWDDNLQIGDLIAGLDVLEVSGFRRDTDTLQDALEATFIERKDPMDVDEYEVLGRIRDLDTTAQTFRIGRQLIVNYSTARLDDIAQLANGMLVEVEDEFLTYAGFQMVASKVEAFSVLALDDDVLDEDGDGLADEDFDHVHFEGVITAVDDATSTFTLNGMTVHHDMNTTFRFGDATLLAKGTKVQVEGNVVADVFEALKIKFSDNAARIDGIVDSVDVNGEFVVVFGINVGLNDATERRDARDDVEPFDINDAVTGLVMGDFVEVRGAIVPGGLLASELERDQVDATEIRGVVNNLDVDAQTLSLLGVALTVSANTQYRGPNDEELMAGDFFGLLTDGQTIVEADWDQSLLSTGTPFPPVRQLEIED